jgi:Tol biopolymer transport system component
MLRNFAILLVLVPAAVLTACLNEAGRGGTAAAVATHASDIRTWRAWSGEGVDLSGAPSPDGKLLSYVDWETGDLAVRELETGAHRRLTAKGTWQDSEEYALASVFAPDGNAVAYSWFRPQPDQLIHYELRVVELDGGEPRVVYSNPGNVPYLVPMAWSPDGRHVLTVLYAADRTTQLALVDVASGEAQVLKSLGWREPGKAVYSPDGGFVAYDVPADGTNSPRDLFVLATDGSREMPVARDVADDRVLGWLTSGELVFLSDRTGRPGIWSQPMRAGRPAGAATLLVPDAWAVRGIGAAGNRLMYGVAVESPRVIAGAIDAERGGVLVELAPLPHQSADRHGPLDWSPDGRALAYTFRAVPQQAALMRVMVRGADGGSAAREIEIEFERVRHVRWSPDGGSLLLVGAGPQGRGGIYRLVLASGQLERIAVNPPGATYARSPEWDGDARSIRFLRHEPPPAPTGLVSLDVASGEERLLRALPPGVAAARSPDGEWQAVIVAEPRDRARLEVFPADGPAAARTLVHFDPDDAHGGVNWQGGLNWTPDGRYLIYSRSQLDGRGTVWAIPVAGGEPRLLFEDRSIAEVRLHPDGRRIAFTRERERFELWVLER